jgi:hypothetical protein
MTKWIEGNPADGVYYYLVVETDGSANITQLNDGKWRWEARSPNSFSWLDMNGWYR